MKNLTIINKNSIQGFSLVELMIAMTLGLLIVGATLSIFSTNKQAYRTTENLGRVQESGRTAFELMARDIREAGGNPCDSKLPVANRLNNTGAWGGSLATGILDFDNGALGASLAGTDAIEVSSGQGASVTVVSHTVGGPFILNTVNHGLNTADIVMACDFGQATIFQISAANPTVTNTIAHAATGTPGNCSANLGLPTGCATPSGYTYDANSQLVRLNATQWYVGNDNVLYRRIMRNMAGVIVTQDEAIIDNVLDMQITYLINGANNYVSVVPAGRLLDVVSVRVELTMQSQDVITTNNSIAGYCPSSPNQVASPTLKRCFAQTINLRNRTS